MKTSNSARLVVILTLAIAAIGAAAFYTMAPQAVNAGRQGLTDAALRDSEKSVYGFASSPQVVSLCRTILNSNAEIGKAKKDAKAYFKAHGVTLPPNIEVHVEPAGRMAAHMSTSTTARTRCVCLCVCWRGWCICICGCWRSASTT